MKKYIDFCTKFQGPLLVTGMILLLVVAGLSFLEIKKSSNSSRYEAREIFEEVLSARAWQMEKGCTK